MSARTSRVTSNLSLSLMVFMPGQLAIVPIGSGGSRHRARLFQPPTMLPPQAASGLQVADAGAGVGPPTGAAPASGEAGASSPPEVGSRTSGGRSSQAPSTRQTLAAAMPDAARMLEMMPAGPSG